MKPTQYEVSGSLTYILYCPKAPDLDHPCLDARECPGHEYQVDVMLYVIAPDSERAINQALGKLKSAYPWGLFADAPPFVRPVDNVPAIAAGPQLPGFEGV